MLELETLITKARATMFKKILIPVDGSDCGERAADFGLEIARRLKARVVLTNALIEYTTIKDGHRTLGPSSERAGALGVKFETRLAEGRYLSVGDGILEAGQETGCDLIVMGTHGREGLGRLLLGSVAERVSRQANVPVMLVRELEHSSAPFRLERILVAVDGSPQSDLALSTANDLAVTLGASLEVINVTPDIPAVYSYTAYEYAPMINFEQYQHELEAESQAILAAALARLERSSSKASSIHASRIPANGTRIGDVIVKTANEQKADLIVLGTHGRSGMDRLLLGSVAERVSHHASAPVLIVRSLAVQTNVLTKADSSKSASENVISAG
jgi:nucleotide-binding universal stress UspA family protein